MVLALVSRIPLFIVGNTGFNVGSSHCFICYFKILPSTKLRWPKVTSRVSCICFKMIFTCIDHVLRLMFSNIKIDGLAWSSNAYKMFIFNMNLICLYACLSYLVHIRFNTCYVGLTVRVPSFMDRVFWGDSKIWWVFIIRESEIYCFKFFLIFQCLW